MEEIDTYFFEEEELNEVITDKKEIIIKQTYTCYCYDNNKKESEYYVIKGEKITLQFILTCLTQQGYKKECNHSFLEGIEKTPNTEIQYELCFGS